MQSTNPYSVVPVHNGYAVLRHRDAAVLGVCGNQAAAQRWAQSLNDLARRRVEETIAQTHRFDEIKRQCKGNLKRAMQQYQAEKQAKARAAQRIGDILTPEEIAALEIGNPRGN